MRSARSWPHSVSRPSTLLGVDVPSPRPRAVSGSVLPVRRPRGIWKAFENLKNRGFINAVRVAANEAAQAGYFKAWMVAPHENGTLKNAIAAKVVAKGSGINKRIEMRLGARHPGAVLLDQGGIVRPRVRKFLAIPMPYRFVRKAPRFTGKPHVLIKKGSSIGLYRKLRNRKLELRYVLRRFTKHTPKPGPKGYLAMGMDEATKRFNQVMPETLVRVLNGGKLAERTGFFVAGVNAESI